MQIQKKIEDIKFTPMTVFGEEMEVSEDIVMASAAGWYVGSVCKSEYGIEPFDRHTGYFATSYEAKAVLDSGEVPVCSVCDGVF